MFADTIKGKLAPTLARKKSRALQDAADRKTDEMRQYEYVVARDSVLGELSALPVSATQECISNAKAARRKERLELVNSQVLCPRHVAEAARLRKDMDEVENMRCAKHVYLADDPYAPPELRDNPPPGFMKPTPEQLEEMGLDGEMLSPKTTSGLQFTSKIRWFGGQIQNQGLWWRLGDQPQLKTIGITTSTKMQTLKRRITVTLWKLVTP